MAGNSGLKIEWNTPLESGKKQIDKFYLDRFLYCDTIFMPGGYDRKFFIIVFLGELCRSVLILWSHSLPTDPSNFIPNLRTNGFSNRFDWCAY